MSVVPAKLPRAPQYTRADGTLLPRADTKVQISNKQGGGLPLLQDTQLIETLVHFSRERIPERVVHAKAAGVHGYFEATHDISDFLTGIGKRTELTTRISTVSPEKCSADTVRDVPSYATSKTSTHSCRFQTQRLRAPYPLITNTNFEALPRTVTSDHACIYYTRQMSLIYNTIIRSLNASHHHCSAFLSEDPKSPESMAFIEHDPDLGQIADFLEYNRLIFKIIDRHHRVEEEHMFQKIEDLLADVGGPRGSMEGNVAQHQAFEAGLSVFEAYVFKTQPREFQPHTLLHIIESFAPILIDHLHDKIATLLTLHVLKSEDLMKIWKKAEFEATKDDDMYTSLPFILGCQDPTFELDGEAHEVEERSSDQDLELSDIFPALVAARGLFSDYTLHMGKGQVSFLDREFPLGFSNPVLELLDKLQTETKDSIQLLVSVGCGEVADEDIPDLLRLAKATYPAMVKLPVGSDRLLSSYADPPPHPPTTQTKGSRNASSLG